MNKKITITFVLIVSIFLIVYYYLYTQPNSSQLDGIYREINNEYNSIKLITKEDGKLYGVGLAISDKNNSAPNVGEFEGFIDVKGEKGFYKDEYCQVEIQFANKKLLVKDNDQCGGLGVTFTGEYIKK